MSAPTAPGPPTYRYLTVADDDARAALARLAAEPLLGFDTETDWDVTGKRQRLSLVQFAPPAGDVLVVDAHALDLALLRPVVEGPTPRLVAHNASFDATVLAAVGLRAQGLVDTLRLAREALHLPAYGLADLVATLFGATLDKSLQRSAWRKRPLSTAQLAYAAADACWVLRVYDALRVRLEAEGRWADALARAALAPRPGPSAAPKRKRAPPAAPTLPPLTPEQRGLVEAMKVWRRDYALAQRRQAYLICPDRTLEDLARARPRTLEDLQSIYGLGEAKVRRFGADVLAALAAAVAAPPPPKTTARRAKIAPEAPKAAPTSPDGDTK